MDHSADDVLAGATVSVIVSIGFILIVTVLIGCYRIPAMRGSFGILTANQNFSQLIALNCRLSYTHFGWLFTSDLTIETCGSKYRTFLLSSQSALSFMILAADVTTIILLVLKRNVLGSMSKEARRTERNFALQVLLQGVVFNAHSIWISNAFQWLPGDSNEWKLFFTSTFSSNLLMIFDPAVVIVFNREFRQWLFTSRSTVFVATISASQRSPKSTPKNTTNANSIMVVSPFNAN
ncbi:Protein CBG22815 [Caenorhabditis briggsae]|uniref:Protein CBG22815 n=1 Tax=Caenorhabditis briggsae TaxID=6238 RepID=A8Y346_CAEBR|nr:Protein CBG22815 [Caenorhabditis briggsae]CAP39315.2 Protein CBG22815 [Caenorhabditis briggsae]